MIIIQERKNKRSLSKTSLNFLYVYFSICFPHNYKNNRLLINRCLQIRNLDRPFMTARRNTIHIPCTFHFDLQCNHDFPIETERTPI